MALFFDTKGICWVLLAILAVILVCLLDLRCSAARDERARREEAPQFVPPAAWNSATPAITKRAVTRAAAVSKTSRSRRIHPASSPMPARSVSQMAPVQTARMRRKKRTLLTAREPETSPAAPKKISR